MTGDTQTPCTAHRAVKLAFDELAPMAPEGRLTFAQIAQYAAARANRTPREVLRVIERGVRLGTIRSEQTTRGVLYERVILPDAGSVRELRHAASRRPKDALHYKPDWTWRRPGESA